MPFRLAAALLTLLVSASVSASGAAPAAADDPIATAVGAADRREADRARDADRRPAAVLGFAGVGLGDRVAELGTGAGYYADLLARVVGPEGHVYATNSPSFAERFPDRHEAMQALADAMENLSYQVTELTEVPADDLDAVFLILFYHDTVHLGLDRTAMNRAVFEALKPGGIYLVVDHRAASGADEQVTRDLHRGLAPETRAEIEAVGFRFTGESDALAHPEDPRTDSVFAEGRRGKTDRFIYRFERPAQTSPTSPDR